MTTDPRKSSHLPPTLAILGCLAAALMGILAGLAIQQSRAGAAFGSAAISNPTLERAEAAFRQGDDQVAVRQFSKLADENNPVAQYWLGHMYELGLGATRNPAKAIELYKKAAARDVVEAQLRLGEIYMHGDLAPPDFAAAKSYLDSAAYHGDPRAAMLLGQIYRLGLGTAVDMKEAYAWLEVATVEGDAFAEHERDASLHELGTEDQKDAIARVKSILAQIKHEAAPQNAPTSKQG